MALLKQMLFPTTPFLSRHVKHRLQLDYQSPFILGYLIAIVLLQSINRFARDQRVKSILLLKLSTVQRLIGTFNLDCNGRRALLGRLNCFVFAFDRGTVKALVRSLIIDVWDNLHSAKTDDVLDSRHRIVLDSSDGSAKSQVTIDDVHTNNNGILLVEHL